MKGVVVDWHSTRVPQEAQFGEVPTHWGRLVDQRSGGGVRRTVHGRKLGDVWGGRDVAYVNTSVWEMKESVVAVRPVLAFAHS